MNRLSGLAASVVGPDLVLVRALQRLWLVVGPRRRRQFLILVLLMLLGSAADLISIGVVFPFLVALTAPAVIMEQTIAKPVLQALGIQTHDALILALTLTVIGAVAVSNAVRLAVTYLCIRYGYAIGTDLGVHIFRGALHQPFSVHVARNSSVLIGTIMVKVSTVVHGVLMPMLFLVNAAMILSLAIGALVWTWPWAALAAMCVVAVSQMAIGSMSKRPLQSNSQRISDGSTQVVKVLQEGLGGIRDVLLEGSQDVHAHTFEISDRRMRRAQADNAALSAAPRYAMEFVGVAVLAGVAYTLARAQSDFVTIVPTLGLLAMGAQRLLPYLQQALNSWMTVGGNSVVLLDTLELLEPLIVASDQSSPAPMKFTRNVELRQASFRYAPGSPMVLESVTCSFAKGSRVGFMGPTGSGKSTCLDILMGLLEPSQGALLVDGKAVDQTSVRAWQAHVAHVPQSIFLIDATIEENIALGVPRGQIDRELLVRAASSAQIHETIQAMSEGYATRVGERGVRLSGGQRQRIGIARALYKRADVIFFDEATSALDMQTEAAVAQAIHELGRDVTVFIVAHRLTTLQHCDEVIEFVDGRIRRRGSYASLVAGAARQT